MSLPRVFSWIGVAVLGLGSLAVATWSDGQPATPAARTERIAADAATPEDRAVVERALGHRLGGGP